MAEGLNTHVGANVSEEVRNAALNDEFRMKLVSTIATTRNQARQNAMLLELIEGIADKITRTPDVECAFELARYDVQEKEARLNFLLEMQKKHYPVDYERNIRD